MKKVVLSLLLGIVILTGCGSKNETVKCTMKQEQTGVSINGVITVELKNKKFDSAEFVFDATIDEAYLNYKSQFVSALEKQFSSFEKNYGATPKVESTDNGAKVTVIMTSEQAEKFYGKSNSKEVTKSDVIEEFKKQGYTCE